MRKVTLSEAILILDRDLGYLKKWLDKKDGKAWGTISLQVHKIIKQILIKYSAKFIEMKVESLLDQLENPGAVKAALKINKDNNPIH